LPIGHQNADALSCSAGDLRPIARTSRESRNFGRNENIGAGKNSRADILVKSLLTHGQLICPLRDKLPSTRDAAVRLAG
jgi:hypothetical protein